MGVLELWELTTKSEEVGAHLLGCVGSDPNEYL